MRIVVRMFTLAVALASCGGSPEPTQPAPAQEPPATAAAAPAQPAAVKAGWVVQDMRTPESAYLDEGSGYLFVSQIDGQPNEKDGKGRISKIGLDGTVVTADWFTRLNAPKGLRSYGGTLWVADLDEVVGIDVASAKENARIKIDGAIFLNDVAIGADGTVYVSDMLGGRIYAIKDGKSAVFAEGEQLEHPNGLFVEGERLIVGGWGTKPAADFSTKVPGHLYSLDLKTKQKTLITKQPLGNIDGVEQEARGGYLVTDYLAGKLLQVSPSGESRVVRTFKPGLADHTFLYAQGDILIAPHMNENTVAAYDISADMK
jgi:sugar lactone lactonase YvrE